MEGNNELCRREDRHRNGGSRGTQAGRGRPALCRADAAAAHDRRGHGALCELCARLLQRGHRPQCGVLLHAPAGLRPRGRGRDVRAFTLPNAILQTDELHRPGGRCRAPGAGAVHRRVPGGREALDQPWLHHLPAVRDRQNRRDTLFRRANMQIQGPDAHREVRYPALRGRSARSSRAAGHGAAFFGGHNHHSHRGGDAVSGRSAALLVRGRAGRRRGRRWASS